MSTILARIKVYAPPSTISFIASAQETGEVNFITWNQLLITYDGKLGSIFSFLRILYQVVRIEVDHVMKFSFPLSIGLFCSLTLCQLSPSCHHGTCVTVNETQRCNCDPGFTGYLCESRLAPCDLDPCGDRGKCVPSADGFICQCHPWWQGK